MLLEPQAHIYSSKTDDELLVLAADPGSLLETAQRALADELRRRNLVVSNRVDIGDAIPDSLSSCTAYLVRAKWVGLWLLNTLIATLGVAITAGFFTYSSREFVS